MKYTYRILFFLSLIGSSLQSRAQYMVSLSGPTSINAGSSYSYNANWTLYGSPTSPPSGGTYTWTVYGGTVYSSYNNYAYIGWSGSGSISYEYVVGGQTYYAYLYVSASGCAANPSVTFTLGSGTCSPRTLSYSGTPPSGTVWYWQTSSSGTSTANSTNTYNVTAVGTYYVRAYQSSTNCWSPGTASYYVGTVNALPATPNTFNVSSDLCGSKALTYNGSAPSGVTWYWQGQNGGGTSTTSTGTYLAQTSGTYYLRARNNTTGCWSASSSYANVTVNEIPVVPTTPTLSNEVCGPRTLSKTGSAPAGVTWYWQGTAPMGTDYTSGIATAATFPVSTSGTYYIRARSSAGCWSATSTAISVTITPVTTAPAVPSVSSNTCDAKTLSKTGSPPGGVSWYWQGSASTGTDYTSGTATAATYTVSSSGTYYIRARSTAGCWSPATSVTITITPTPAAPPVPSASTNTCDVKIITKPTAPGGVTYYWQGTNASGTDNTSGTALGATFTANTSANYYLRARANGVNCWSATSTLINLTVNPVDLSVSAYDAANPVVQATASVRLLPGFTVNAGSNFTARIVISEECNKFVNWTEQTVFNQSGQPIGASRTYADGFGNALQSQTRDFLNNKVFGSQSLFNLYGVPVGSTLAAPILETDFIYKANLASNATGTPYSAPDFDVRTGTAPGIINNPKPFGTQPGTIGWYYSTSNTLEPNTPTTQFPYSRTFVPEGPDPTISRGADPGDAYRMGNGHESKSERMPIAFGELNHYYSLRTYFVQTPPTYGANLLGHLNTQTTTGFTGYSASVASAGGYITATSNQANGTPGIWPMGGTINVTPNTRYVFSVRGYKLSDSNPVNLYVRNGTAGANIIWTGALLPTGTSKMDWVSSSFLVPVGVTQITVGVLWSTAAVGSTFTLEKVELRAEVPALAGYKYISTDADGKRVVAFEDADGRSLASAMITSGPPFAYDNWSYTYYNDAGQVVAEVAPNGVNTSSAALPGFTTTYQYDHLGRMIEVTSPDEGTSRFVYTLDGRIRFSENQEQRNATPNKKFSYTNYDKLGRPVESGEYTSTAGGYVFEPHTTTTPATLSVLNIVENNTSRPIDQVAAGNYTGVSKKLDATRCAQHSFISYDLDDPVEPFAQKNLYGQVSKTENENATSWYSYDEYGQLVWMKQNITGLGIKTLDYTYDYFGNVTQVAYQAGQTDKFYHHYEYDANQRLIKVYTSLDGTNKTLHANYLYYLHGPLKRVELATNLQGIDYVYTITGALKSINHSDVAKDPGGDGSNGFTADVFGQLMDYYTNDYTGAAYSTGSVTASGLIDQYGGAVRDISWFTPVDNPSSKKVYGYTYDSRNQLQNAQFGTLTGTTNYTASLSANNYNENIPAYDKNGNIQNLIRKSKTGTTLGNYGYNYQAGTNKVNTITNSGGAMMSYQYNTIGQMKQQDETGVGTLKVAYTAYGLTHDVRNASNQLLVSYAYDDRGNKIKKQSYNAGSLLKTTWYVHDAGGNVVAIYEHPNPGTLTLAEVPIYGGSRLGMYKPGNGTFYEINDHLGNVRAVIGPPETVVYTATMETENQTAENAQFNDTIGSRFVSTPANNTPGGNEVIRVNNGQVSGGYPGRLVGPGIKLRVAPGDVITAEVWGYHEGGSGYSNTLPAATVANAVATLFGGVNGAVGDPGKTYSAFNQVYTGGGYAGGAGSGSDNIPAGYLNFVMFNNDLLPNAAELPMAASVLTAGAFTKQKLTIGPITIPAPGYVYIYVNSNSNSPNWVSFDDLKITHVQSPFVAGADFYPFGLTMTDREILTEQYRFGYQGQYSEEDNATKWNEFDLRMYDARFAGWISPDPYGQFASPYLGMGNIPNSAIDYDGGYVYFVGRNNLSLLKALNKWYATPLGKKILDVYLNDPNKHLFISRGKTRQISSTDIGNNQVLEVGADGITTSHYSQDFSNNNYVINFVGRSGKYEYFQNFNGLKLPSSISGDEITLITLKNNTHDRTASALSHETGSHAVFKDSPNHEVWASGPLPRSRGDHKLSPYRYSPISWEATARRQLGQVGPNIPRAIGELVLRRGLSMAVVGLSNSARKIIRTPRFRH